jgi:hypothetical protein
MTQSISYHFSATPSSVFDGVTVPYFKSKQFNTCHLVVYDQSNPSQAVNALKANGFNVIVDIEQPCWAGGQQKDTPITQFANFFKMLHDIGVEYASSEGGRDGDLDYLKGFFKGYVNYNCDQCGLWKDYYKHPLTVMNSWESYYTWEWPDIQKGIQASQGKKQGILAGTWEGGQNPILTATKTANGSLTYFDMADWISKNSINGLDHFHIWSGLNEQSLAQYKALGFDVIVAVMQGIYPPIPIGGQGSDNITEQLRATPAVCVIDGDVYTFVRGTDKSNSLWCQKNDDNWVNLKGTLMSGVGACAGPDGSIHIAVAGTSGFVWKIIMNKDGTWGAWNKDKKGGIVG